MIKLTVKITYFLYIKLVGESVQGEDLEEEEGKKVQFIMKNEPISCFHCL